MRKLYRNHFEANKDFYNKVIVCNDCTKSNAVYIFFLITMIVSIVVGLYIYRLRLDIKAYENALIENKKVIQKYVKEHEGWRERVVRLENAYDNYFNTGGMVDKDEN